MAFAYNTAVAGAGTVSCAGTTTVTGSGTSFAFGFGSVPTGTQARVGGTITVGANTRTIVAIASATSLTVDTAFPTFTSQTFTVQTGITQTGTDTMNLSLGSATGFLITNRGDLFRTFDCRGLDLTINGTLTVSSSVAQLRNDGSCNNRLTVNGSVSGGELIFNGRISTAGNGPIPYAGLDWLGTNGMGGATALVSTNATYPAKLTVIDACIRFGGDWFTVSSGNFARITTQGEECWILCAKGTGTVQARIRLNNTTPVIDLQATQTWIGTWLNFGVPQISLKGFTPIFTDGPEINLSSVSVATRIDIENYDTRYIQSAYYPGSQIVPYGGAWIRFKNNLLGTNIVWQSLNVGGANYNVIEYSKQIKAISKDALGNVLNDGYFYFQPVGANVSGIRAKGGTSNITFDLTAKTLPISGGFATTEFIYAWDYANTTGLHNTPDYFCSVTTKGAETHPGFLSRYGYDKQPITLALSGNNTFEVSASHASLPTSDKVIATAQAITGIAFNFTTKVMTITGNLTYQQIYDAYQYALNTTANLFQADNCLTANSTSDYVGWTINVSTGVTISTGSGNFTKLKANTITLTGTAAITGIYQDSTGTSTVLELNTPSNGYSLCIFKADGTTKYFASNVNTGSYYVYFAPSEAGTYYLGAESYGLKRQNETLVLNGGTVWFNCTDQEDVGITDNKATASAYTTLSTTSQIYDATAIFRLSETGIKLGQLCTRDGLYLDFGTYNVKIKDDASAIVAVSSGTITYKSIVVNETTKYNAMKATPPKTITPTDTEIINVLIEDASGDSQVSILGGDNLGYELWKVTTATPTDNYATGTLLTTLATNALPYRFIGISGFDIVGRDTSSGVRRRSSMLKGSYEQAFYVGNQIQLATDAPQLLSTIDKLDELTLKVDTNLDVKVSTRLADADYIDPATAQQIWEYTTRTLTSAGAAGATLAEIEASTILAKEATSQAIKTKTDKMEFNAQNHIAANVHQLQAGAITSIQNGLALETTSQDIKTKVLTLNNYDDATTQTKLDALQTDVDVIESTMYAVQSNLSDKPSLVDIENSTILAKETSVQDVKTKVDTLTNYDDATAQSKLDAIKAKTDTLVNTDLTGITADLTIINNGIKKASLLIPHTDNL
jgi:hypothetical protein